MSEESLATLEEFIGRQEEPQPDLPKDTPSNDRVPADQAVWLVLSTHLRGLEYTGVIDERSAGRVGRVVESVGTQQAESQSLRKTIQALEEQVDSGLPSELAGAATLGLAHEEWSDTAVRVMLRPAALSLVDAVSQAQRAMLAMAELHAVSLMQGFHTGQPVQPVTFGHLLGGAISPTASGLQRLLDATDLFNRSPLGAGSMSGEVVGAERSDIATWLGFREPIPNTYDAVANIEDHVALVEAVASVAAPVGRLLAELALQVRTDPSSMVLGEAWMRSPDQHLPGFSAVERLVALSDELRGVSPAAQAIVTRLRQMPYGPIGGAADWIARDIEELLRSAIVAILQVDELFRSSLTVNRAYLANRAGRGYTTANDLAAFLMSEEQLPPSVARNIAALTLRRLREENLEISAIAPDHVDMAAMMVIGRDLKIEMETLGRWFAPRRFLERRLVEGSPAPAKTREWIERERSANLEAIERTAARRLQIRDAEASVRKWIADIGAESDD